MKVFYSIIFFFFSLSLFGQNYTRDAGMYMGNGLMASYRQFYKDDRAAEAIVGYRDKGLQVIGLRQFIRPIFTHRSDNFQFVYGYGIHAGFSYINKYRIVNREYRNDHYAFTPLFGFDGWAGIEYTMPEVPFVVSLSSRPFIEFSTLQYFRVEIIELSMAIKYRF